MHFSWVQANGKSHLAQAIGQAAIQQNYRVIYRETHVLLEELAEAVMEGKRKQFMESVATVPLLIIDDFGMRKLPLTAAEDLLEIIMRRYERTSTLLTSNRPLKTGKLLAMWPQSLPCSTASFIMGTCSSAARGVGERKPRPLRWESSMNLGGTTGDRKHRGVLGTLSPKTPWISAFPPVVPPRFIEDLPPQRSRFSFANSAGRT